MEIRRGARRVGAKCRCPPTVAAAPTGPFDRRGLRHHCGASEAFGLLGSAWLLRVPRRGERVVAVQSSNRVRTAQAPPIRAASEAALAMKTCPIWGPIIATAENDLSR